MIAYESTYLCIDGQGRWVRVVDRIAGLVVARILLDASAGV